VYLSVKRHNGDGVRARDNYTTRVGAFERSPMAHADCSGEFVRAFGRH